MSNDIDFSVVLCTYNGEKYLPEQLGSILTQSYLPKELVVCDDGSKDSTLEILKEYKEKAPFDVRIYLNETNLGFVKNFEKACCNAQYQYVVFCDQDDYWENNKLERFAQTINEYKDVEMIFSNAKLFGEATGDQTLWEKVGFGKKERRKFQKNRFSFLLNHWVVTGATVVCKKSLIDYAVPFSLKFAHDEWLALMAANRNTIIELDEILTNYRIHSSQQIGVKEVADAGYKTNLIIAIERMEIILNKLREDAHNNEKNIGILNGFKSYYEKRLRMCGENVISRFFMSFSSLIKGEHHAYTDKPFRAFIGCIIRH